MSNENFAEALDFFIKEFPKCPLCYYTAMELAKYRKDKGRAFDTSQFRNITFSELLDFEIKLKKLIGDMFFRDDITAMQYLAQFIEVYPDYKGWLNLLIPKNCETAAGCDYHFNLPIKSKKKDINAVATRMIDLLAKKANILLRDFNIYSTHIRNFWLNDLINVLNEHLLMIYQCMIYHRPEIYTDIFKELKLNPFDIKLETHNAD